MIKAMWEKVLPFSYILQTAKVFPANFIGAILSANICIYTECCLYSCQPQKYILHYDKSSETQKVVLLHKFYHLQYINNCVYTYVLIYIIMYSLCS